MRNWFKKFCSLLDEVNEEMQRTGMYVAVMSSYGLVWLDPELQDIKENKTQK